MGSSFQRSLSTLFKGKKSKILLLWISYGTQFGRCIDFGQDNSVNSSDYIVVRSFCYCTGTKTGVGHRANSILRVSRLGFLIFFLFPSLLQFDVFYFDDCNLFYLLANRRDERMSTEKWAKHESELSLDLSNDRRGVRLLRGGDLRIRVQKNGTV